MRQIKSRLLTSICLCVCAGIVVFGFWPFGYQPINTARLLDNGKGIHFEGKKDRLKLKTGGVAYTPHPIEYPQTGDSEKGSFSIEIWAEAAEKFQSGVGSVAVLAGEGSDHKILIGQWKSSLIIRTFFYKSKRSRHYREIGAREVLPANHSNFITITSDPKGTSVYKNGGLVRQISGVRLIPENESLHGYRIFFGNGPNACSPWSGNIYGFALYDRALTEAEVLSSYRNWAIHSKPEEKTVSGSIVRYDFEAVSERTVNSSAGRENSLLIPKHFDFKQKFLNLGRSSELDKGDIFINIAGFVPLGFFLPLWLFHAHHIQLWRSLLIVIFAGFLFSLGIEFFQTYMPTRDSTQLDLLCNTAGTLLGVSLAYWCTRRRNVFHLII